MHTIGKTPMDKEIKRIAVTGGSGQIAYSLLFRIANGDLLGQDQPISLHILEVPSVLPSLQGVKMELEDCCFPLLRNVVVGDNPLEVFQGVHYALLVGAKPRGPGMERKDLLQDNGKIFVEQGRALDTVADASVKVFVVGNPCNTNCLIALSQAKRLDPAHFYAMMRLDQNRATSQLAQKAQVLIEQVTHMTIWGNHSTTQVPDFFHAQISGQPVLSVITDHSWLENEFIPIVQKRGAAVLGARGKSSAASAANALIDAVRDVIRPTAKGSWFSNAVLTKNNPYGIANDLIFSFPCQSDREGNCTIMKLELNEFLQKRIKASEQELIEERDLVSSMLKR